MVSHVCVPKKWPFQESTTMESPLTSFSLSYSIEPPALSLPLLNAVATIRRPPSICVTLETTINKEGRVSVKKSQFLTFSPPTIFGCCAMKMDSPMLSPRDGDPRESTSLSGGLPLSDDVYGGLTDIVKVGEGSRTVDERSERFHSATINIRSFDSY